MATKTFEELKQLAIQIRDEKTNKQNTATRVGTAMLEHINKLEQDYYDKTTINNRTSEYNVSINHPTSGISSSNKYDLSSAIAQVPAELRSSGLTVSFLNADGNTEKWEFGGGSWEAGGFEQVGAGKLSWLYENIFGIPIFSKGGIDANTGNSVVNEGRVRTDDFYIVDYNLSSDIGIISYLYDENKAYLGYVALNKKQTSETALKSYPTAKFAKFSVDSIDYNISGYAVTIESISLLRTAIKELDNKTSDDIIDYYNSLLFVGYEDILPYFEVGGIDANTGNEAENEERLYTPDYYEMDYNLTYSSGFSLIAYLYDENKKYLGYISANNKQTSETAISQFGDAKLARFSIMSTDISPLSGHAKYRFTPLRKLQDALDQIKTIKGETEGLPLFVAGGIDASTGSIAENSDRMRTDDFYEVNFRLSGIPMIVYAYDKTGAYLGFISTNTIQSSSTVKKTYPTAVKVRFSILTTSSEGLNGYSYVYTYSIKDLTDKIDSLKTKEAYNILEGKKWAYCGDSFSAGGYSSAEKTENDVMPAESKFAGKNKVYGYIIADRNNMTIQDFAAGGRTMATPADGSFTNCFSLLYKNIDPDVDYITTYFGINDSHHVPGGSAGDGEDNTGEIPIGNIDDNDTSTFCGAYNVVMEYLLQNYPFAHIGIIVSNGCDTPEYAEKTIQIAKKWGIPYIDLNEAPVMIRSQSSTVSSTAKNIVNLKQRISSTNMHPNTKAHEYESTFIENFLRSL